MMDIHGQHIPTQNLESTFNPGVLVGSIYVAGDRKHFTGDMCIRLPINVTEGRLYGSD